MRRLILVALVAGSALAEESPNLGAAVSAADLALVDYTVLPDGSGLPTGSANAQQGAAVYVQNCLACHGEGGKDGLNDRLAGGQGSLLTDKPLRTVGSFWPYATTLFDYVRRAMPYQAPGSLSNDEVYAVTAYVLFLNGIVAEDADINAETLPKVIMPNAGNVVWQIRGQ
ncbi:MAG: c-type cytochrome [Woeseiaceae bacterium]|nr:c-type cytochrome [Woeseiaceae bacterium]